MVSITLRADLALCCLFIRLVVLRVQVADPASASSSASAPAAVAEAAPVVSDTKKRAAKNKHAPGRSTSMRCLEGGFWGWLERRVYDMSSLRLEPLLCSHR